MIKPEQAIILSLNEPRNYSKLYEESRKCRKSENQTLSRETFDRALKNLVFDGFVSKKDLDGRTKQYSLNSTEDTEETKQIFFKFNKELKQKIVRFEKILLKMDLKQAKSSSKKRKQYEVIFAQIFLLCLEYQKRLFFFIHMPFPNTSLEKIISDEQSRIGKMLTTLPTLLPNISPNSFDTVAGAMRFVIDDDIARNEEGLEKSVEKIIGKI